LFCVRCRHSSRHTLDSPSLRARDPVPRIGRYKSKSKSRATYKPKSGGRPARSVRERRGPRWPLRKGTANSVRKCKANAGATSSNPAKKIRRLGQSKNLPTYTSGRPRPTRRREGATKKISTLRLSGRFPQHFSVGIGQDHRSCARLSASFGGAVNIGSAD
jgi:hypothetical protein